MVPDLFMRAELNTRALQSREQGLLYSLLLAECGVALLLLREKVI